jgi:hypothetical protein
MKTNKIKIWFISLCLLTFISAGFFFMFFDVSTLITKYREFIHYSKTHVGAIVYNNTNKTMQITDYKWVRKLPPGKSSRDIGIFDADGLIVDQPVYFEDNVHFDGVLKFCDYSRLKLIEKDGVLEIQAKNVWICKILNDFDFYNSLDEAFH